MSCTSQAEPGAKCIKDWVDHGAVNSAYEACHWLLCSKGSPRPSNERIVSFHEFPFLECSCGILLAVYQTVFKPPQVWQTFSSPIPWGPLIGPKNGDFQGMLRNKNNFWQKDFGAIGLWVIKMLSVLSSWLSYSLVSFLNKNKPWVFRNIFPCARHLKLLFIVLFIIWMKVKLSVNQNCLPGPKIWFWKLQLSMWSLKPQQGTRV